MALAISSHTVDLTLCILTILTAIYLFYKSKYKYWEKLGVPFAKPCLFFGNFKDNFLGKKCINDVHVQIYEEFKHERYVGFFEMHTPNLLLIDPSLIHHVMVKDFAHFHDRAGWTPDAKKDPLTNNISFIKGEQWRSLRYKLTPLFSTGKIKGMFDQVYNSVDELLAELNEKCRTGEDFPIKDAFAIFTTSALASCAFGVQFKPKSPEYEKFKTMIISAFPHSKFTVLISVLQSVSRKLASYLGFNTFTKEVNEYFIDFVKETIDYRKENGIRRNDFLQLMMDLKDDDQTKDNLFENETEENDEIHQLHHDANYFSEIDGTKEEQMSVESIAASSFLFLFAGLETVSTTLSNVLYDLATHPEAQTRLQAEVDNVIARHGGYSYQAIKDMQYMDQVIQESMRVHSIGVVDRECTVPYRIPGTDVVLERGTKITLPLISLHADPRHYPEPEAFKPERFEGNNYKSSPAYIPWGSGPRMCIAIRFAVMEMKVCLARVLSEYTFRLSPHTLLPLRLDPQAFFPTIAGGIWLTVHRRRD